MGCCFSSHHPSASQKHYNHGAPRLVEEETVKEVLSETPKSKPPFHEEEEEEENPKKNATIPKPKPESISKPKPVSKMEEERAQTEESQELEAPSEEISQVTELCSLSESVSTTAADWREDGEVRQRVQRSPAKSRGPTPLSGEAMVRSGRGVAKSPVGRPVTSSGRARLGPGSGRETGQLSGPRRRDIGELSARRSVSPAATGMKRTNPGAPRSGPGVMGRSPSTRKTGRSPRRIPPSASENRTITVEGVHDGRDESNESLENPLVSLECFIFL